jgi:hypothetical protein
MEKFKNNIALAVLENYEKIYLNKFKSTSKSSIFTSAFLKTIKFLKLESICSEYNADYFCKIIAIEIYNNELRIHIQERGNMSLGSLQNPKYSKIYEEESDKSFKVINMKFTVADERRAYDGYLSFDLQLLKEGVNYLFEYGQYGYTRVPIFHYLGKGEISGIDKTLTENKLK